MDISNLIKSLELGICRAELLYKPNPETTEFDWDKVLFNLKYHTPEFYDNKFDKSPEIRNIPGYEKIIDLIVKKNEDNSPLKEMDLRNNVDKDYINEELVSTK